jgi:hypothetical protein
MPRILPDIPTLEQHLALVFRDPERYRPEACDACGLARPWAHGCYTRKADRLPEGNDRRDPLPIPRFICRNPACRRTCSRLPSCIPPRRWYLWAVQQALLLYLLSGGSLSATARCFAPRRGPARSTLRRWLGGLIEAPASWAFLLKSHFVALARWGDGPPFWCAALRELGLAEVMTTLDAQGVCVP